MSWQNKQLVAAIDFGTTFSGYCISIYKDHAVAGDGENRLRLITRLWNAGLLRTEKTPTVVLLKPDREFEAFGYEAQNKYAKLCEKNKHKEYYYLQNFKMKLYGGKTHMPIHLGSRIRDAQGKEMLAVEVFAHAIMYLKKQIEDTIKESLPAYYADEICYILTCPAIWSEQSKLFMKTAAKYAQIPEDRLKIALEPECASVYIYREEIPSFSSPVERYLIADIGGGTLDVAVHEINALNKVEEIISPDGGPWGGINVNDKFEQFLVSMSGAEAFLRFKEECMEDYLTLMRTFEMKKCEFSDDEDVRITLPYTFRKLHEDCNGEDLKESLKHHPQTDSLAVIHDKIGMERTSFLALHEETVDQIVNKIQSILKEISVLVPLIFCVGGFSSCAVLKMRLKKVFETEDVKVVFPPDAVSAIMKGAIILARDESIVTQRISRFTIGVDWNVKFDPAVHPKSKLECAGTEKYCKDIFKQIVRKGQALPSGEPVFTVSAQVKTETQTVIEFPFYRSDILENPTYIDDIGCHLMGSMSIPMEDVTDGLSRFAHLTVYVAQILRAEAKDQHGETHTVKLHLGDTIINLVTAFLLDIVTKKVEQF